MRPHSWPRSGSSFCCRPKAVPTPYRLPDFTLSWSVQTCGLGRAAAPQSHYPQNLNLVVDEWRAFEVSESDFDMSVRSRTMFNTWRETRWTSSMDETTRDV